MAQVGRPKNRPADTTRHYYPHINGKVRNYSFSYLKYIPPPSLYVPWQREFKCGCLKFPKHLNEGSQPHQVPLRLCPGTGEHTVLPTKGSSRIQPPSLCRSTATKRITRCHHQRGKMLIQQTVLNDSSRYAFYVPMPRKYPGAMLWPPQEPLLLSLGTTESPLS